MNLPWYLTFIAWTKSLISAAEKSKNTKQLVFENLIVILIQFFICLEKHLRNEDVFFDFVSLTAHSHSLQGSRQTTSLTSARQDVEIFFSSFFARRLGKSPSVKSNKKERHVSRPFKRKMFKHFLGHFLEVIDKCALKLFCNSTAIEL